jgi:hypothetical protein
MVVDDHDSDHGSSSTCSDSILRRYLGKRWFIGVSHAGQDGPPFSATQVAENEGAGKTAFSGSV